LLNVAEIVLHDVLVGKKLKASLSLK
jgi:hypothetical protein